MSVRKQGLTLLEVLAAFLIFSMVFTVLVGSSQTGVRSQGLSVRRLQAHEIAESAMARLEIAMARRELPSIEEEERELDEFIIRVREMSFSSELEASTNSDSLSASGSADILSQLAAQLPEVGKYLMRYEVEVEWTEASRPEKITRTTFAFDWPEFEVENASLFAAGGAEAGGSTAGRDGDSSADGDSSKAGDSSRSKNDTERRAEQRAGGDAGGDGSRGGDSLEQQKEELRRAFQRFLDGRGGQ